MLVLSLIGFALLVGLLVARHERAFEADWSALYGGEMRAAIENLRGMLDAEDASAARLSVSALEAAAAATSKARRDELLAAGVGFVATIATGRLDQLRRLRLLGRMVDAVAHGPGGAEVEALRRALEGAVARPDASTLPVLTARQLAAWRALLAAVR